MKIFCLQCSRKFWAFSASMYFVFSSLIRDSERSTKRSRSAACKLWYHTLTLRSWPSPVRLSNLYETLMCSYDAAAQIRRLHNQNTVCTSQHHLFHEPTSSLKAKEQICFPLFPPLSSCSALHKKASLMCFDLLHVNYSDLIHMCVRVYLIRNGFMREYELFRD